MIKSITIFNSEELNDKTVFIPQKLIQFIQKLSEISEKISKYIHAKLILNGKSLQIINKSSLFDHWIKNRPQIIKIPPTSNYLFLKRFIKIHFGYFCWKRIRLEPALILDIGPWHQKLRVTDHHLGVLFISRDPLAQFSWKLSWTCHDYYY